MTFDDDNDFGFDHEFEYPYQGRLDACPFCGASAKVYATGFVKFQSKQCGVHLVVKCNSHRCGLAIDRTVLVDRTIFANKDENREEVKAMLLDMINLWNMRLHVGNLVVPGLVSECVFCGSPAWIKAANPDVGVIVRCMNPGCAQLTIPPQRGMTPARVRGLITTATNRWNKRATTNKNEKGE